MKRKLRIEELSVASFATGEDGFPSQRGTIRGFVIDTNPVPTEGTCLGLRTCDFSCQGVARTCYATCDTCISCGGGICP